MSTSIFKGRLGPWPARAAWKLAIMARSIPGRCTLKFHDFHRQVPDPLMRPEAWDASSVFPAWGRFLLRLAAIALPFLTLLHGMGPGVDALSLGDSCARLYLELLLWALVLPSIVVLVCVASMVGRRQRYAIAVAVPVVGSWLVIAFVTLWIPYGTCVAIGGFD